jgi:NADH-quinone oxidoreductase subunit K
MIHLWPVLMLVAVLAGAGMYGVLARRNAVLVLIGVELLLNAGTLLLVVADAVLGDELHSGQVLTIFVITLAAAEVGVALAVVLLLFRTRGDVDLRSATELGEAREWVP